MGLKFRAGTAIRNSSWKETELQWSEEAGKRVALSQLQRRGPGMTDRDDWRPLSLEEVRKQHIQRVVGMCKGNRLRAAQVLGIGAHEFVPVSKTGRLRSDGKGSFGGERAPIKARADASKNQRGLKTSGAGWLVSGTGASRATK